MKIEIKIGKDEHKDIWDTVANLAGSDSLRVSDESPPKYYIVTDHDIYDIISEYSGIFDSCRFKLRKVRKGEKIIITFTGT